MLNKVILMGRFTRDAELRSTPQGISTCSFSLAVDRNFVKPGEERKADFINCVSFGRTAEFAEKYYHKGTKVLVTGRIQTGSYTNKDGQRVYTTDIIADDIEFAESKNSAGSDGGYNGGGSSRPAAPAAAGDGFMNIPDGIDEELPFN